MASHSPVRAARSGVSCSRLSKNLGPSACNPCCRLFSAAGKQVSRHCIVCSHRCCTWIKPALPPPASTPPVSLTALRASSSTAICMIVGARRWLVHLTAGTPLEQPLSRAQASLPACADWMNARTVDSEQITTICMQEVCTAAVLAGPGVESKGNGQQCSNKSQKLQTKVPHIDSANIHEIRACNPPNETNIQPQQHNCTYKHPTRKESIHVHDQGRPIPEPNIQQRR